MAKGKAKGGKLGRQSKKGFEGRFWEKVSPEPNSGCWIWIAASNPTGYGVFFRNRRIGLAHRLSYEHFVGKIPDGLSLDHKCRNTFCVNPDHLEPVTHQENVRRGVAGEVAGDRQRAIQFCPSGHEYTPDNIYYRTKNKHRECKACSMQRSRLNQRIVRANRSEKENDALRIYWREYRRKRRSLGKS